MLNYLSLCGMIGGMMWSVQVPVAVAVRPTITSPRNTFNTFKFLTAKRSDAECFDYMTRTTAEWHEGLLTHQRLLECYHFTHHYVLFALRLDHIISHHLQIEKKWKVWLTYWAGIGSLWGEIWLEERVFQTLGRGQCLCAPGFEKPSPPIRFRPKVTLYSLNVKSLRIYDFQLN